MTWALPATATPVPPPRSPRPATGMALLIVGILLGLYGLPCSGLFIFAAIVVAASLD